MNTFTDPGNPPFYFILLKIWFTVFGWSEQAGRFLSVLIGTMAIPITYFTVRYISGKKPAFLAALFMASSTYLIGYSQEMRAYVLEIVLALLVMLVFLRLLDTQNAICLILYTLLSILMVNTHYYGVLLISGNFIFFIIYKLYNKIYVWKNTFFFFIGNVIIAFSLLPYFLYTALNKALLNQGFNTQIAELNLEFFIALFSIILFLFGYYLLRTHFCRKEDNKKYLLCDYTIVVSCLIFIQAFVFSLFRPIISWKYFTICLPLLMIFIAVIASRFWSMQKLRFVGAILAFSFLVYISENEKGGSYDVYKANQEFVTADIKAHQDYDAAEITNPLYIAFYKLPAIPIYSPKFDISKNIDIIYINPLYQKEHETYRTLQNNGLSSTNVLKFVANSDRTIFKKIIKDGE
jgi:4-amino-4-deoxy-L-arabinose transferase-like glycosyltransferase